MKGRFCPDYSPSEAPKIQEVITAIFSPVWALLRTIDTCFLQKGKESRKGSLYTETQSGLTSAFLSASSKEQSKLSSSSDKGGQKKCMAGGTTGDPRMRGLKGLLPKLFGRKRMNPPGPVGMNRWNLTPHAWAVFKATLLTFHVTETLQVLGTQGLWGWGMSVKRKGRGLKAAAAPPLCFSQTLALHPLPTRQA